MAKIQQRIVLALLCFVGFVIVYMLRVNLSVAIVAMVNSTSQTKLNYSSSDSECLPDRTDNQTSIKAGEFNWDAQTQGFILSSFFWGYILTQVPGGLLSERFGAKWVLGIGVLWTAVLTLLTPLAARWSYTALICLRVLEGIGEGVTFPSLNALLSQWAPPLERTMMSVFIVSGSHMGTVVGLPLSGYMCAGEFLGGWPSVFYVFGAIGIIWFFFWCFLAYSSPQSHPWISSEERHFIQSRLRHQVAVRSQSSSANRRVPSKIPVKAMLTSPAVLSLVCMHMSNNWLFYTLLTCLPKFLADVLKTPLSEDGFDSALPYLALWMVANVAAITVDFVRGKAWLSVTTLRKISITFGAICGAVGIAIVGNLGCDHALTVGILTASVGLSGVTVSGLSPNQLDLAPQFAGTLLGFSNSMATIPGMVAPVVVGWLTNEESTRANWLKVFYLSAGIVTFGCLCYLAFGSGVVQAWAEVEPDWNVGGDNEGYGDNDGDEASGLLSSADDEDGLGQIQNAGK